MHFFCENGKSFFINLIDLKFWESGIAASARSNPPPHANLVALCCILSHHPWGAIELNVGEVPVQSAAKNADDGSQQL